LLKKKEVGCTFLSLWTLWLMAADIYALSAFILRDQLFHVY
jgi:hypothetical protein